MSMRYATIKAILALTMAIALGVSIVALGAPSEKPVRARLYDTFEAIKAWDSFCLLADEEGLSLKTTLPGLPVLLISDLSGKQVSLAVWDGKTTKIDLSKNEWFIVIESQIEGKQMSFELRSTWTPKTPFKWGLVKLSLDVTSDVTWASKYLYSLRFPSSAMWTAKDGSYAILESVENRTDALNDYMILRVSGIGASFATGKIRKNDYTLAVAEIRTNLRKPDNAANTKLIELLITCTRAWSEVPVLNLVESWVSGVSKPDVKIFGAVDKQKASPGEQLTYTTTYLMQGWITHLV
jgi:hypothetical protein